MLHITNGEIAARRLKRAFPGDECISWIDVLHEGPVPSGLSLDQLAVVRAHFLADRGWATIEDALRDLMRRNLLLAEHSRDNEVVLWFEHDLFDQLQLLEILNWFAEGGRGTTRLTLINIDRYPGIEPFYGIGQLSPEQMKNTIDERAEVSPPQLNLAADAWSAFRSRTPQPIQTLIETDLSLLPFLRAALHRLLEEYPWTSNGLSRSECQLLRAASRQSTRHRTEIFQDTYEFESAIFMGDTSAFSRLEKLASSPKAALRYVEEEAFAVTEFGYQLLANEADWIQANGLDTWIGGTHLRHDEWRWNGSQIIRVS